MTDIEQDIEIIDAATAQKYLEANTSNRPLRARHVHQLADDMAEGKWVYTPDPIAFRADGVLMNGQHRLSAVVIANRGADEPITIRSSVVRGLSEESWAHIDRGIKRSTGDEFARNGIPNAAQLASCARLLWRYENNQWSKDARVGDDYLLDYVTDVHPGLAKTIPDGKRLARESGMLPSASIVCLYLSRSAELEESGLDHADWEAQVIDGLGFSDYNAPARQWRRQVANRRSNSLKTAPRTWVALYAKAFRAWAQGRSVKMFKAPRDIDPMPCIERPLS